MPQNPGLTKQPIIRFRDKTLTATDDTLAVEEPLDIRVRVGGNDRSVAITMRTPGQDDDLARGFLFTEGVLPANVDISVVTDKENVVIVILPPSQTIDWKRLERHSYTSSSCGVCGKTSLEQVYAAVPYGDTPGMGFSVASEVVSLLPARLRAAQELFEQTGGIHAAGLFDLSGSLLHFAEDVGRHNALDKLIGYTLRHSILPLEQHLLLLSGRASFELIQKSAMAGIGLVAAVGAPSSLAAQLAEEMGITLCGFVRSGGFNVYCGKERLIFSS